MNSLEFIVETERVDHGTNGLQLALIFSLQLFFLQYAQADSDRYPYSANNVQGRLLWIANCEGCHAYGIAGSPDPRKADDWTSRLRKPRTTLYNNAILGFFGPDGKHMPARGGNEQLTDPEVRAAVDYMLELAIRTIDTEETRQ